MTMLTAQSSADRADFVTTLAHANIQPLWDRFRSLITHEPKAPDSAMAWRWSAMQPLIERAVQEVPMEEAERRVLILANPAFNGLAQTTTNLNAALQILQPGETAHAHRHRLAAIRFVLEGGGCRTLVDDKYCEMARGDLVLTPPMTWHSHENYGSTRTVWLDGLDLPLALFTLGVVTFEFNAHGNPSQTEPRSIADAALAQGGVRPIVVAPRGNRASLYRYEWEAVARTLDALEPRQDGTKLVQYVNPVTGGAVMPTLDCYALELKGGLRTVRRRTTHNTVVAVMDGEGATRIGERTIHWTKNDIFTIPHWNWTSHSAISSSAHLFLMTDREVLSRLAYLVEESED